MLFAFRCLKLEKLKVQKCLSKQKIKSDFKAKSMTELQKRGVLVVEIPRL